MRGVFEARKKDGSIYYRANISYKGHHISLGSSEEEEAAGRMYEQAKEFTEDTAFEHELPQGVVAATERVTHELDKYPGLNFENLVSMVNLRDNGIYIGNPIYLLSGFFLYFLTPQDVLKFDRDDLFYYSNHRIMKRGGHLFVNDFGMQVSLLSRYGVRSHGVKGVDYLFANGDDFDFRYENMEIINPWHGVFRTEKRGKITYIAKIHIDGYYQVGRYDDAVSAAIAYNKAVDMARAGGIDKNFQENYIEDLSAREYAAIYTDIALSKKYVDYIGQKSRKETKDEYHV